MNKIEYTVGVLQRMVKHIINGKPYVSLEDAEFVVRNSGMFEEQPNNKPTEDSIKDILDILDIRPGEWPYDDCDVKEYYEYFIKGTNIKLGFRYIDGETGKENYYCIVCDGYGQMDPYDSEAELFEHFEWMLINKELIWRYYE